MKENYFFVWNYNKIPLVYSIMNKNEKNILILNIKDSLELEREFEKLSGLEKIHKVILFKNNHCEYIKNIFYRVFIYPFKNKNSSKAFYLDGFVGYYPLILANIGNPDDVYFYEEGESIYQHGVLLNKKLKSHKDIINEVVKKILFIKRNDIYDIKAFFVRDKARLEGILSPVFSKGLPFDVHQVNDAKFIRDIPAHDKDIFKQVFFKELNCCDMLRDKSNKKAIILTQPIHVYGRYTKKESVDLFNKYILELKKQDYKLFLKLHPQEKEDLYIVDDVHRLHGKFPFEMLALFDIEFEKGVTYNSTAINSTLIKEKILIKDLDN